jgi:hypothetical protein
MQTLSKFRQYWSHALAHSPSYVTRARCRRVQSFLFYYVRHVIKRAKSTVPAARLHMVGRQSFLRFSIKLVKNNLASPDNPLKREELNALTSSTPLTLHTQTFAKITENECVLCAVFKDFYNCKSL